MSNSDNLELRWQSYNAALAKGNSLNKATVFGALFSGGITSVTVSFDGEGDSGQIENVTALVGERTVEFPGAVVTIYRAQSGSEELATHKMLLQEAIEELCYGYLEQDYGGWENNDGAFGEFIFDVATRKIGLEFNSRFTDHARYDNVF